MGSLKGATSPGGEQELGSLKGATSPGGEQQLERCVLRSRGLGLKAKGVCTNYIITYYPCKEMEITEKDNATCKKKRTCRN